MGRIRQVTVEDTFNVTGRGLVAVGQGEVYDVLPGSPWRVEIRTPGGDVLERLAYKEWLLVRTQPVMEREAFVLRDTKKEEVPVGSVLTFLGLAERP